MLKISGSIAWKKKEVTESMVKKFYTSKEISIAELGLDSMNPNEFFCGYTDFSYNQKMFLIYAYLVWYLHVILIIFDLNLISYYSWGLFFCRNNF